MENWPPRCASGAEKVGEHAANASLRRMAAGRGCNSRARSRLRLWSAGSACGAEHRTFNIEHRTSRAESQGGGFPARTPNTEHRTPDAGDRRAHRRNIPTSMFDVERSMFDVSVASPPPPARLSRKASAQRRRHGRQQVRARHTSPRENLLSAFPLLPEKGAA